IAKHVHALSSAIGLVHKIVDIIPHLELPVPARAHLVTLEVEKLIRDYIIRKNVSMELQHHREDDAVKYDVVLADEVKQLGTFIIPVRFPVLLVVDTPLPCCAYVAD